MAAPLVIPIASAGITGARVAAPYIANLVRQYGPRVLDSVAGTGIGAYVGDKLFSKRVDTGEGVASFPDLDELEKTKKELEEIIKKGSKTPLPDQEKITGNVTPIPDMSDLTEPLITPIPEKIDTSSVTPIPEQKSFDDYILTMAKENKSKIYEDDILKAYTDIKYATTEDKKAVHEALGITSGNFTSPQLEKIYSFRNPGKTWELGNSDYDKANGKIKNFYSEQHGYEIIKGKTFEKNRVQRLTVNSYLKDVDTLMTEMKKNPNLNYSAAFDKLFGQNYSPKGLKNAKFNFWNEKYKNNKKSGLMEEEQIKFMDNLVENQPKIQAQYRQELRPITWDLYTKTNAWKTFDQGTKDVINNTATEIVNASGFKGQTRRKLRGQVDSIVARFISKATRQEATGEEIAEVILKVDKEKLSNLLTKKQKLSDDIDLARSAGIDLDTIDLSHMEAIADNWKTGLEIDNLFLSKANLNRSFQIKTENQLKKILNEIKQIKKSPNIPTSKIELKKLNIELKSIEQDLIDRNLITKVEGKTFGKIDPKDPYKIKPLETEIKETRPLVESRTKDLLDRLGIKDVDKIEYEPVRKEIISKLKYVGLREGGIININKLIRPL